MKQVLVLAGGLLLGAPFPAAAQEAASTPLSVGLRSAVSVSARGSTDFGVIPNLQHDEVIDPTAPSPSQSTAQFTITGTPGEAVQIQLGGCPILLTQLQTSATLPFRSRVAHNALDDQVGAAPLAECQASLSTTIPKTGAIHLFVGGRLQVGPNQPAGPYSGQFTVSVVTP